MKLKSYFCVLCAFSLVGCATQPIPTSLADPVPESRIFNNDTSIAGEHGFISIKRDSGLMGSACSSLVYIDGIERAEIYSGEHFKAKVKAGEHIVSAWPKGVCGGAMKEIEAKILPGKTKTYRIGYGSNGDYFISPTAF